MSENKKTGPQGEKWVQELSEQAFERSIFTFILHFQPWGPMLLGAAVAGLTFALIYLFYLLYTW